MDLYGSVIQIKGVGEKSATLLNKLGIFTIEDLIQYYPRDYAFYKDIVRDENLKASDIPMGYLFQVSSYQGKYLRNIYFSQAKVSNGKTEISLKFYNAPFLKNVLKPGMSYVFYGILKTSKSGFYMEQPKIYKEDDYTELTKSLQPIYKLTKGITTKTLSKYIKNGLQEIIREEYLPDWVINDNQIMPIQEALCSIHFPSCEEQLIKARKSIIYREILLFIFSIQKYKITERPMSNYSIIEHAGCNRFLERLNFHLTGAQKKVWSDILNDMTGEYCMNRMIQGDVGSGKTIIAILALLLCVYNNYQGAFMAPTEILATQHFEKLEKLSKEYQLPFKAVLLTGSTSKKIKKQYYEQIKNGEVNLVIGTHAIIEEGVEFADLALVITDEQHRFGVKQREKLSAKGKLPHILVMSATPIPRSLAMILYGDVQLSVIDELPANRLPIKNCVVNTSYRSKAYDFILKEIKNGHQAYIVCPMVEESDGLNNVVNVTDYAAYLHTVFSDDIQIGILHGKQKNDLKNHVMEEFAAGNIDILVSTTVIEVGIDVPNATVMMIENAERFGLAQLHQLRGRIGRGNAQSFCIFINGSEQKKENQRLEILNSTNDGFIIAEKDLEFRGPGDLTGVRQSGVMDFKIADICRDALIFESAEKTVQKILHQDPLLNTEENQKLRQYIEVSGRNFIDFRTI